MAQDKLTPVIGVDGCPAGWIAVIWGETLAHRLYPHFADILAEDASVIAVDIPIGLPPLSGRAAERATRAVLGERQSSVFTVPARASFAAGDYRAACNINLLHSEPPRKISKQCHGIFPKIREVDALMTPELQRRVHEVHPEAAFWAMNGGVPVPFAKKVRSDNHRPGLDYRRQLLRDNGFPLAALPDNRYRRSDVGEDDLLDACAAAWSARRILHGLHLEFPAQEHRDEKGLRMVIKA